jgi:AcrR family transcriptional regulator
MPLSKPAASATRILDAAELAFAENGFEGASLRDIVREARVNLATVYYHFRSKEGLLAAVLHRRFAPLRQEHLDRLRLAVVAAPGKRPRIEAVLEAVLLPPLRLTADANAVNRIATRLIGRMVTDPSPEAQGILRRQHQAVRKAFVAALRRCLPQLPLADLHWRYEFIWGGLAFVLCNPSRIEERSGGLCNPADTSAVLAQMIRFFGAGLKARPVS